MKFIIEREKLIKPLQKVNNSISMRPILPILCNLLLKLENHTLSLIGTDLEIEIIANIKLKEIIKNGSITVPSRKFFDICRSFPNQSKITISLEKKYLIITSKKTRFSLSTLPSDDFPITHKIKTKIKFNISQNKLKNLIESTQFSMANQDVRYYLNGMLFETEKNKLRCVATDGHRLAICTLNTDQNILKKSIIIPRKGIIELTRILENNEKNLKIIIGNNNIRIYFDNFIFTSKLIHARFPDYQQVLPKNPDKILVANYEKIKQAFLRASILSNEKFKGVRLYITKNKLTITANNQEQEESEEIIDVQYDNEILEIGFNVNYILDVLNVLKSKKIYLLLTNSNSSIKIKEENNNSVFYIIMPMRL